MRLLVLNTDEKEFSYGGVCPFMRNMHPYLEEEFELSYMTLPRSWSSIRLGGIERLGWLGRLGRLGRIEIRIPGSTRMKYLMYMWLHRRALKKVDFILSHGPEGSYVASFSGVPYAHIYHGNSNPMSISRFRIGKYFAKMYDRMFERIDKTASLVYTVGPARNDKQKKLFNPLKQNVKPQDIDKRSGFVFAGRLESMKNVDRLINIYSKLPDDVKAANPFYIAGYGTQEKALKEEVRRIEGLGMLEEGEKVRRLERLEGLERLDGLGESGAAGRVVFLGKVDNTKMLETDADKKILLMASSTEGMPTAIAEAFSVGLPVVSTAVGDIPTVVKNGVNGYLLPLDFKDEDYIDAIVKIMNNYESFAKAAYESSVLFNREKITRGVIDDITEIFQPY